MDQKTEQLIQAYLADEDKLMNDWYKTLGHPDADPDVTPVGSLPPDKIDEVFEDWADGNKKVLVRICEKWLALKDKKEVGAAFLIATLADLLTVLCTDFTVPVNSPATACILVTKGYIDRFCAKKVC